MDFSLLPSLTRLTLPYLLLFSLLWIVDRCHRILAVVQHSTDPHRRRPVRFVCHWNRIFRDLDQMSHHARREMTRSPTRTLLGRLFHVDTTVILVNDVLVFK